MRIFDRLVGLETEYAIVPGAIAPGSPLGWEKLTRFACYRRLVEVLRQRTTVATALHFKEGVFTASSGAVWFESERFAVDTGLIEGATPECRGPIEAAIYQQAQDRLLTECSLLARSTRDHNETPLDFRLLKNDRDAAGNVYGSQENYEAVIASGWRLAAWRIGLTLLLIPATLTWASLLLVLLAFLIYVVLFSLAATTWRAIRGKPSRWEAWLLHPQWLDNPSETRMPLPDWLERTMLVVFNLAILPIELPLTLLVKTVAFAPQRRALEAFLMTRAVFAGAGMLTAEGDFGLADKGPAMNCLVGYGDFLFRRPVFNFGHFLKTIGAEIPFSPLDLRDLYVSRQRLQIGLGDSNMAPVAELLRIGATALVLDVIESESRGEVPPSPWPRLRHPLKALRQVCADPTLQTEVELTDGRSMTAVELQRWYAERCQTFLEQFPQPAADAIALCRLWTDTLDKLEHAPQELLGRIDWITKRHLLERAGDGLPWEAKKKIDLRYHELSPDGYFRRFEAAGGVEHWAGEGEIERAMRSPPPDSPATMRGHYIREFSGGEDLLRVGWRKITIGSGWGRRVVRLRRYRRASDSDTATPRTDSEPFRDE